MADIDYMASAQIPNSYTVVQCGRVAC